MLTDTPLTWLVVTGPGTEARTAADRVIAAEHPSIYLSSWNDPVEVANVNRIRNIAWTVSGVVLAVGLAAFVIAAIDRSLERRREVAALHVLGAPTSLSWSSQLLQVLVPVGFGVPAAIALGLLSGAALLSLATARDAVPLDTVATAGALAMLAALAAAAASTLGVPRRISPELLRRE
jgi:predicted lysophospholipase L1 biosynthesis ABC-type transport system permease subunit